MNLIFLFGPPAVGKLTIARELEKITGYKVFHNHLTVDFVWSMFEFGTPEFIRMRDLIWIEMMVGAARAGSEGLIFTFAPEPTVPADFISRLESRLHEVGSQVTFVELVCSVPELEKRISAPSRSEFKKLTSIEVFREIVRSGKLSSSGMPKPRLKINTQAQDPKEVAITIAEII